MSDYISNDQNYAIFFNSVYGNNSCPSFERYSGQLNNKVSLFDEEVGFNAQENVFNQYEGARRCYQQRKMFGPDFALNDGNSLSESIDISHVGELQRLSSNLIRLLSEARQNTLKVKASCGVSQRPQHDQRTKGQKDSGPTRCRRAERQFAASQGHSLETGSPAHDASLVEHESNAPVGDNSNYNVASPICTFAPADKPSVTSDVPRKEPSLPSSDTPKEDKERDRQKKDTHNKIEKRRRSIINDRITELGNLLPEHIDRVSCQKKGSILKESIDYIKKLRKEQERVHRLEDQMRETFLEIKKLAIRLEQVEFRVTNNVANNGGTDHLQDLTSVKPNFNNCLTVPPATNRQHAAQTLQDHRPDVLTAVSEVLALDEVWDDLSSTLSVDSAISLPSTSGMDIDEMDYYI